MGFDVTRRETLHGCDRRIKELRKINPGCVIVAVGNKIDLADSREVSAEEARAHFETVHPSVPYFETSAKTGEGVNELFEAVTRMIVEREIVYINNNEDDEDDEKAAKDEKCIIC